MKGDDFCGNILLYLFFEGRAKLHFYDFFFLFQNSSLCEKGSEMVICRRAGPRCYPDAGE